MPSITIKLRTLRHEGEVGIVSVLRKFCSGLPEDRKEIYTRILGAATVKDDGTAPHLLGLVQLTANAFGDELVVEEPEIAEWQTQRERRSWLRMNELLKQQWGMETLEMFLSLEWVNAAPAEI